MSAILGGEVSMGLGEPRAEYHVAAPPPLPAPIRKMPIKLERVYFDGEYEGWWADIRVNAPFGSFMDMLDLLGGDDDESNERALRAAQAMRELVKSLPALVKSWNFVDEMGEPLPCDMTGFRQLSRDLIMLLVNKANAGPTVPKG